MVFFNFLYPTTPSDCNTFHKQRLLVLLCFFCITLTSSIYCHAQSSVILKDKNIESLGSKLYYHIQQNGEEINIESLIQSDLGIDWISNKSEHLNLGFEQNTVWLKLKVLNNSNIEDWYLYLDMPYLDSIDFYVVNQDNIHLKELNITTGWYYPYDSRGNIKSSGFTLPLNLESHTENTYYLRVKSSNPVLFPISITTKSEAIEQSQNNHIWYGIYFGIMLVVFLYNFVVFLMFKDVNYFYYVFSIVFTFLVFASVSGYLFKYFYPETPEINAYIVRASMVGIIFSTGIFAISFLELKKNSRQSYLFFIGIFIIAPIGFLLDVTITNESVNNITKVHAFSLLVIGIYIWKQGNKFAFFYSIAWAGYLLGGLLITLRNSGALPVNFWTTHGAEIGSAMEVVILSVALADRYRIIQREKEEITKKALMLEQTNSLELEEKVRSRTLKLNESNEELAQTNEELSTSIEVVEKQNILIQNKNKNITSSINYAKRIQDAILPSKERIKNCFKDSFVLFLPKDLVSGDFYFFYSTNKHNFIAVADCTGHGVPGSLMSMIGTNLLRESIVEKAMLLPSEILMNIHKEIQSILKQKETGNQDGMDIALCIIDKEKNSLCFSGAKNSLLEVNSDRYIEHKGDKFSIGGTVKTENTTFTDKYIDIDSKASYYMYSDGFQDQFGGNKDKKFMRKKLKNLLLNIHKEPLEKQKDILETTLKEWMQPLNSSQVDDISVLGFKV